MESRLVRACRPLLGLAALVLVALAGTPACGSDARAIDTCRRLESARCEQGPACFKDFLGDVQSCQRFYDVQCGRGVADGVKEPSKTELDRCLAAIKSSCAVALEPQNSPECSFLITNPPADTGAPDTAPADTGTPDVGTAEAATDG